MTSKELNGKNDSCSRTQSIGTFKSIILLITKHILLGVAGNENKAILTREVSIIRERLKAIEADSGFLKHAAMTLQKGGEGTKLLTEIALHLRKLRQSLKVLSEDTDA